MSLYLFILRMFLYFNSIPIPIVTVFFYKLYLGSMSNSDTFLFAPDFLSFEHLQH